MLENVEKEYGIYVVGGDPLDILDRIFPSYEEALEHSKTFTEDETVIVGVVREQEEEK